MGPDANMGGGGGREAGLGPGWVSRQGFYPVGNGKALGTSKREAQQDQLSVVESWVEEESAGRLLWESRR